MIPSPSEATLPRRTRLLLYLLIGVLLGALAPGGNLRAQATSTSPAFEACADLNEEDLRSELNRISQEIFTEGSPNEIDLDAVVARQWTALGMDAVVNRAVDAGVDHVTQNEDLLDKFLSGWSPGKAEELTRAVAQDAFNQEPFRQAIDELATAVAGEIEEEMARLSAESVSINLLCLREFIDRHYSTAIVNAFAADMRQTTANINLADSAAVDSGIMAVVDLHKNALGGVGVIVVTQITRRIVISITRRISARVAGRITTRILGRIGTDLIPVVGWIIGAGLIVYDVMENLDGALPQIRDSLKSEEVKAAIRSEVALSVEPELRRELPVLAREIANDLYNAWLDFQRKYRQVLTLAEQDPDFATLVSRTDDLPKLAEMTDEVLRQSGADGLHRAVVDGSLEAAAQLPSVAVEMLAELGSLETVLAWGELAGADFGVMAAAELYKYQQPGDLDPELLHDLLALDDPGLISELALLQPDQMRTLLTLSRAGLRDLTAALSVAELGQLADVLATLDVTERSRLLVVVAEDPSAVELLDQPALRRYLADGGDITKALTFLRSPADVGGYVTDILRVATRNATVRLFAAKYGGPLTAMTFGGPLLLLLVLLSIIMLPPLFIVKLLRGGGEEDKIPE
ncbi:MAG: hypothetical protein KDD92_07060 [Caldilineaceae bacterium]|nr:hypothetical protein [Caldilineaceae bacterium]